MEAHRLAITVSAITQAAQKMLDCLQQIKRYF
jgi:hypothetical protein